MVSLLFIFLSLSSYYTITCMELEKPYSSEECKSIFRACKKQKLKKMTSLLTNNKALANAKDVTTGNPIIHTALVRSTVDIVELIITYGADINAKETLSRHQNTPLHTILNSDVHSKKIIDRIQKFSLLIKHGAKTNKKNRTGNSPLHFSIHLPDNATFIRLLLENNAQINIQNKIGNTPLHCAASQELPDTLVYLLGKGANPNITNQRKETALHIAAYELNFEKISHLLRYNANILIKNEYKQTPLEIVRGQKSCIDDSKKSTQSEKINAAHVIMLLETIADRDYRKAVTKL